MDVLENETYNLACISCSAFSFIYMSSSTPNYYIDTSVLLENTPLAKIHAKLHPGPEWRIFHILTCEDIDDVISRFFTVVYPNSR